MKVKEMIEEMTEDINNMSERNAYYYEKENGKLVQKEAFADCRAIAEELIRKDWIKPKKDSVVLTREEYEKLKEQINFLRQELSKAVCTMYSEEEFEYKVDKKVEEELNRVEKEARKETAEKSIEIINCVKEKFMNGKRYKEAYKSCQDDFFVQGYIQAIYDCIGELAKQIGCEIKE